MVQAVLKIKKKKNNFFHPSKSSLFSILYLLYKFCNCIVIFAEKTDAKSRNIESCSQLPVRYGLLIRQILWFNLRSGI